MRIVDIIKKENKNLTKIEDRTVHVAQVCLRSRGKAIIIIIIIIKPLFKEGST